MSFINKDTGMTVGVGAHGDMMGLSHFNFGTTFRTHDGGQTWDTVDITDAFGMNDVKMLNSNIGYSCSNEFPESRIYKTIDGGLNRYPQAISYVNPSWPSGATYQFLKLDCLNDSTCIAVGVAGGILVTSNGGGALLGVGIKEEKNKNSVLLFPNPTNDNVTLSLPSLESKITVKIFDCNGKLVLIQNENKTQEISVNVQSLQSGFYTIKIETEKNNFFKKFMKNE